MNLKKLDIAGDKFIIEGRYILKERLGGGSFGQIYSALDKQTNDFVAVKLEKKHPNLHSTLSQEIVVLSILKNEVGFPRFHDHGKEDNFNYLVLDLLGSNLQKLFLLCGQKFSLKTVLMLADQMLVRIGALHKRNFLHRDIKPENFCIGTGTNQNILYMIDFGLARQYIDPKGEHISYRDKKGLVGTARYASLNTHLGIEQSRRDDLEGIGFLIVYFLKGQLPWQTIKANTKEEKYFLIKEQKKQTTVEELCKDLPNEVETYLNYVRNMQFTERPNYKYLRQLFQSLFIRSGYKFDGDYDWVQVLKSQETIQDIVLTAPTKKIEANEEKKEEENLQAKEKVQFIEELDNVPDEKKIKENVRIENKKNSFNPFTRGLCGFSKKVSIKESNCLQNATNREKVNQEKKRTAGNINIVTFFVEKITKNMKKEHVSAGVTNGADSSVVSEWYSQEMGMITAKLEHQALKTRLKTCLEQRAQKDNPLLTGTKRSEAHNQDIGTRENKEEENACSRIIGNELNNFRRSVTQYQTTANSLSPKKRALKERASVLKKTEKDSKFEENLSESSICEWEQENVLNKWMTQRNLD